MTGEALRLIRYDGAVVVVSLDRIVMYSEITVLTEGEPPINLTRIVVDSGAAEPINLDVKETSEEITAILVDVHNEG